MPGQIQRVIGSRCGFLNLSVRKCLSETGAPNFRQMGAGRSLSRSRSAALVAFREKPSGTVRLTLPDHALETTVWPKLGHVLADYPDIKVELYSDNSMRNIVEERFDAGLAAR